MGRGGKGEAGRGGPAGRWWLAAVGLAAAAGLWVGRTGVKLPWSPASRPPRAGVQETGAARGAVGAIGPETELLYRTRFPGCLEPVQEELRPAPPALHGMDLEDLARLYSQWRVVAFDPRLVVLEQEGTGPCPGDLAEWRHVRLVDGVVHIYYGHSGRLGPLKERTGITRDQLPPAERVRLERGIDLQGDEQVRSFLERDP